MQNKRITIEEDGIIKQKCRSCWEFKTLESFAKDKKWYHTKCKECKKKYDAEYRARTKQRRAEKNRAYRMNNLEELNKRAREKYKENSKEYIQRNSDYRRKKVKENWFARERFHEKARKFIKENKITFNKCFACWQEWTLELHHPSYENNDMRCVVVPLCRDCHRWVHSWRLECPEPVNLTALAE